MSVKEFINLLLEGGATFISMFAGYDQDSFDVIVSYQFKWMDKSDQVSFKGDALTEFYEEIVEQLLNDIKGVV